MKKLVLILIIYSLNFSYGHTQQHESHYLKNDSIMILTAEKYLNSKIGSKFVEKYLEINSVDSINGIVSFLIKQQTTTRRRNMIVVFVNGNEIDSLLTPKISKVDINKYYKGIISKNILLNKTYATELANKIGFQKGIKDWSITLKRFLGKITWEISYTKEEQNKGYYYATGEQLNINVRSGRYIIYGWDAIE